MIQMLVSGFQVYNSPYRAVLTACESRRQSANLLGLGGGLTCQETHPAVHLGIRMWEGYIDILSFYNKAPTQGYLDLRSCCLWDPSRGCGWGREERNL